MKNRLKKLPREFKEVLRVCSRLAARAGFKVYLVGGVVRDLLLVRTVFDLDIVVEGDAIELAQALAQKLNCAFCRHHAFGTATLYFGRHKIDFATARQEHYSSWGVLPRVKPAPLEDDCFRRDFTINAMAISLNKADYGRLIDPHQGLADLKAKTIRVLHPASFLDDPTRILRAVRFEQRFGFKIEPATRRYLRRALVQDVLTLVNAHRLRDELILILNEPKPYRCLQRINRLTQFSFLGRGYRLDQDGFKLLLRIERVLPFWRKRLSPYRPLEAWVVYLAGLLVKLSRSRILSWANSFGLRKGERLRLLSVKDNLSRVKRLSRPLGPAAIYRALGPLSFEALVFFYAYYPDRGLRKNIEYFMDKLLESRIKVKAHDLAKIGVEPPKLYSQVMQRLLYVKISKGLKTKKDELREARRIFVRLTSKQKKK